MHGRGIEIVEFAQRADFVQFNGVDIQFRVLLQFGERFRDQRLQEVARVNKAVKTHAQRVTTGGQINGRAQAGCGSENFVCSLA